MTCLQLPRGRHRGQDHTGGGGRAHQCTGGGGGDCERPEGGEIGWHRKRGDKGVRCIRVSGIGLDGGRADQCTGGGGLGREGDAGLVCMQAAYYCRGGGEERGEGGREGDLGGVGWRQS